MAEYSIYFGAQLVDKIECDSFEYEQSTITCLNDKRRVAIVPVSYLIIKNSVKSGTELRPFASPHLKNYPEPQTGIKGIYAINVSSNPERPRYEEIRITKNPDNPNDWIGWFVYNRHIEAFGNSEDEVKQKLREAWANEYKT